MVGLIDEYAVLCRQWARAQHHAECGLRLWRQRCAALESEAMRLRGRLLALRTALLWGLPVPWALTACMTDSARRCDADPTKPLGDAERLLCQVGCQGHAHRALDDDGTCRWRGVACHVSAGGEPVKQSIK